VSLLHDTGITQLLESLVLIYQKMCHNSNIHKEIPEIGMHSYHKKGNKKNTTSEILMLLVVIMNYY